MPWAPCLVRLKEGSAHLLPIRKQCSLVIAEVAPQVLPRFPFLPPFAGTHSFLGSEVLLSLFLFGFVLAIMFSIQPDGRYAFAVDFNLAFQYLYLDSGRLEIFERYDLRFRQRCRERWPFVVRNTVLVVLHCVASPSVGSVQGRHGQCVFSDFGMLSRVGVKEWLVNCKRQSAVGRNSRKEVSFLYLIDSKGHVYTH